MLFLFEESPQIDAADGGSGGIKAVTHVDFLADQINQLGGDVESLRLSLNQHGNDVLRMEVLAVSAMAVGSATTAFALDKGAGQHFAESAEAADEPAAGLELRVDGHSI